MGWTSSFGQVAAFRSRLSAKRPQASSARPRLEQLEDRCVPAIIHVGPTQSLTTIAQAAAAAHDGDDIQIDAGTYTGSGIIGVFTQNNLTIEGVGGRAVLNATGLNIPNRKGIFVIDGTNTTVKNLEFMGAHDSVGADANWAGIRQEGATLTVDHCYFHNNDDGILTSAGATSDILIKYSEFAQNGYGDGQSHNMYIGNVRSFTLEYSYTHDAIAGHDVKSRANTNYILYNWIGDTGAGSASYELTMPNGGTAYVIGNVIRQDPDTQNSTIVDWGSEGAINPTQGVFLINNTIINDRSGGTYVRLNGSGMPVQLVNNIFGGSGGGTVYSGPTATQTTNLTVANPGFANPGTFDYHLTSGSAAINVGTNPGSANGFSLTPTNQYVAVANTQARPVVGALDIGAFEFGTAPSVPAAPTNLTATPGNAQVSLSWTASSGATSYNIYRGTNSGGATLLQTGVGGTSFVSSGLVNGTTYYYQVTAVNTAGESGKSNQVSATPQAPVTVPTAPTNLTATAGNAQVSLSWAASTGATSYNVYRGTTSGGATLLQTGVGGTSFVSSGLTNGTTYYYQVTAVNSAGESGRSTQVSATPQAPITVPAAPANLTATAGNAQVSLSWTASSGATSYNVYRGPTSGGATLLQTGVGGTSFVSSGLTNGTTYYYQVTAVNSAGESGRSNQASATPQAPITVPAAPASLTATAGNAQVSLSWAASSGAASYNVYRGTTSGGATLLQTGISTTSFTSTGLSNGTTYYYQVTAVNSAGESGRSNQASATPQAPAPSASASFVKNDTTTQGSWQTAYGADGYDISQGAVKLPAYATVSLSGNANYVWNGATSDPRALQQPGTTSRLAACWYSGSSFTIDVNITDGQTHQVTLDALDWDSYGPRQERIDVLDAATGTVLDSRTLTNFSGGQDVVWNIKGHVQFRVTNLLGGSNAVISGVFFGGPATANPVVGTGTGLTGQYFADQTLTNLVLTRTDATVNFNWGSGSPAASVPVDHFSARWTGQVQAQFSETYTFYTSSDDGVRLWINGQQLINNWTDHSPTENSATITLVAGQKYSIIMEYYENGGGAVAKLLWSSPSTAKQAVPTSQLYAAATPVVAVNAGGSASGAFLPDGFFTGGGTASVTNAIDTSGVTNPASQSVYQSWRYGNFTYTLTNLTPGKTYTVRLHFSENSVTAAGQKVFNVAINGTQMLTNFDVFASAGGAFKAITRQFTAVANSMGQIVIQFTPVIGNARVNGIEIF